jgi:hypothetical protein
MPLILCSAISTSRETDWEPGNKFTADLMMTLIAVDFAIGNLCW